jgi:methionyl-tRNA formyltransferase
MKMAEKMDAGPVFARIKTQIEEDDNAFILTEKLAHLAAHQSRDMIYSSATGEITPEEQDEKSATYCTKIKKEDGNINWEEDAQTISAKIRAFAGWPGTFTFFKGKRLKILKAKTQNKNYDKGPGTVFRSDGYIHVTAKSGAIILQELQAEGKNAQGINDFINGNPGFINSKLTSSP